MAPSMSIRGIERPGTAALVALVVTLVSTPGLMPASPAPSILPSGKTAGSQITEAAGGPLEEAERLFRERNFPAAEPLFRRVPETSPHYPKAQLRLGTIYYAAGRPDLAETFLRTHLRLQESPEGHTLLAGVLLNQGNFDPAIESARKAIALDKSYARAHTALGMIYATMEDFSRALAAFRSALELDDKDANTWFLLGRSHFLSHQPGMAREALENALKLNPQVVEIYSQLAQTLARLGNSTRAEEVFSRGRREKPPPDASGQGDSHRLRAVPCRVGPGGGELRAVQSRDPVRPSGPGGLLRTRQGPLPDEAVCGSGAGSRAGGDSGPLRLSNPLSSGPHLHGLGRRPQS